MKIQQRSIQNHRSGSNKQPRAETRLTQGHGGQTALGRSVENEDVKSEKELYWDSTWATGETKGKSI